MASLAATHSTADMPRAKIMVVDDSVVVRGLISRWLSADQRFDVLPSARNGKVALEEIDKITPDIVILDIEMPEMDGLTALPFIIKKCSQISVLVASTLTRRNADLSLKCISLGAMDYIAKPESNSSVTTSTEFRQELFAKLDAILETKQRRWGAKAPSQIASQTQPHASPSIARANTLDHVPSPQKTSQSIPQLIHPPHYPMPKCLVIGASTGGPRAVGTVLADAGASLSKVPVLITQHMPPVFTSVFAEHLKAQTGREVHEGVDGEILKAGCVYVAPGGRHMHIGKDVSGQFCIRLGDGAPENFCKPAVDVLFRDACNHYGANLLAVVLTGMGQDGLIGAQQIYKAGARVIVQDEATSAVWGMPGAIAKTGIAQKILPVGQIGANIAAILTGVSK